jgi:hypothetical protein
MTGATTEERDSPRRRTFKAAPGTHFLNRTQRSRRGESQNMSNEFVRCRASMLNTARGGGRKMFEVECYNNVRPPHYGCCENMAVIWRSRPLADRFIGSGRIDLEIRSRVARGGNRHLSGLLAGALIRGENSQSAEAPACDRHGRSRRGYRP